MQPQTLLACSLVLLTAFLWRFRARTSPDFPTLGFPWSLPFLGIVFSLQRHFARFHDWVVDTGTVMGDGVSWSVGFVCCPPVVIVGADPRVVEHILKTQFARYEKGARFRHIMQPFVHTGIFNTDGSDWKRQRKVGAHLFTTRALKQDMSAAFRHNIARALAILEEHVDSERTFDVQDFFFRFTLDTFAEVTFGETVGGLAATDTDTTATAAVTGSAAVTAGRDPDKPSFAVAFDVAQREIAARFYGPAWPLKKLLNFGSERRLSAALATLDECGRDIVERARQRHEVAQQKATAATAADQHAEAHPGVDLLSRFIQYAAETSTCVCAQDLLDIVSNYLPAGRDTTACLLSWAMYEVACSPHLEARLHAECAEVDWGAEALAAQGEDVFSYCRRLPLLHATLQETLRLHPPVPMDPKECVADDVWPDGQRVAAGTMVVYSPYLMGRSEKLWGPTARQFDVDRWLEPLTGQPRKEPSLYTMPVFQAGPRLCLGKSSALVVVTMMLSQMLQRYTIKRLQTAATYDVSIALPVKGGLPMKLERRTVRDSLGQPNQHDIEQKNTL